jgi:hypothetical protein
LGCSSSRIAKTSLGLAITPYGIINIFSTSRIWDDHVLQIHNMEEEKTLQKKDKKKT